VSKPTLIRPNSWTAGKPSTWRNRSICRQFANRGSAYALFDHEASNTVFGLLVIAGSLGAFLAPPFTGLDTLPSLGVVLVSLGVVLEDFAVVVLGLIVGGAGILLEIVLGKAAIRGIGNIF
jgi:hypothetical protein